MSREERGGHLLDLLRKGHIFVFADIGFSLVGESLLVQVASSWQFQNVTEETARRDLDRAQSVLADLKRASAEFATLTDSLRPTYELVDDPGMGPVLLARLRDGELNGATISPCLDCPKRLPNAATGYGEGVEHDGMGYETPEEAARGDIPKRYARVVRVDYSADGTRAVVLLATNEPPVIEYYGVRCDLENGRWFPGDGWTVERIGAGQTVDERLL